MTTGMAAAAGVLRPDYLDYLTLTSLPQNPWDSDASSSREMVTVTVTSCGRIPLLQQVASSSSMLNISYIYL
jgi:hypothetical protein